MPEAGAIFLDGELLEKNPKNATGIGYMFQKDHLFEWRDIFSNVSLGLEIQKKLNTETKQELSDLLSDYGLAGFEHAKPSAFRRYASESRSHTYTGTETGSAFIR